MGTLGVRRVLVDPELQDALHRFRDRWTEPAIAVALTLRGRRSMWLWCEALDALDAELDPLLPRERTRLLTSGAK
jgi:hypothetical protein